MTIPLLYPFPMGDGMAKNSDCQRIIEDLANQGVLMDSSGNAVLSTAGAGMIFKTPDGLHTYKLSIDNDGSLVTEQLT